MSAQRAFTLPIDLAAARAHFRDFRQTLQYLPDLCLVKIYAPDQYRILYSAVHAGVYRVDLYSDIRVQHDETGDVFRVSPLRGIAPAAPKVTLGSLTGQGNYSSRLSLRAAGACTSARYDVRITATLPKPMGLKLVPDAAVRLFVERVVRRRVQEISDSFMQRSIERLRPRHRASA